MEYRFGFFVLSVLLSTVQLSRADETKCSDVKTKFDQINPLFTTITKIQTDLNTESSSAVAVVNKLKGEIRTYTVSIIAGSCEDDAKKSQVSALLTDIDTYNSDIEKVVEDYTKKTNEITQQFNTGCKDLTATAPPDLVTAVDSLLTAITGASKTETDALTKFKTDKVSEKTIESANKLSKDIFSCVREYNFKLVSTDITKFNDSLTKHLDEVVKVSNDLKNNLTSKVDSFVYAANQMSAFGKDHDKKDFSKCVLDTNVTARVEAAEKIFYSSFGDISKNLTDYLNNDLKKKNDDSKAKFDKCSDIKCIDDLLTDVKTLKSTIDDDIKNYKINNVTTIAQAKEKEILTAFDKEADNTLNCYLKVLTSGSVSVSSYSIFGYLVVFSLYFVYIRV